mmetsp:Transcript_8490/g.22051  ORF Transcript_8490/g.22051 Transcript_8490/m.22051 type:complete len:531 (-) Transcript_8490:69-1661(-)
MSGAAHGLWEGGSPVSDDEKRKRERGKANKRNERERFKRLNAQLAELVTKHLPELPPRSVPKNQNVLDCVLLEDVIKAVKSERARLGLAMPAARADSANFTAARRGQGMSKRLRETSRARLEALSEAAPALPSPGPTQADVPALHREGLLKSETMGVMLLRVKDMHVIEGSRALDLLCPGAPGGRFRGYKDQSLYMVVWPSDKPAIERVQVEAMTGLLRMGLTVSVRLLRCNQDEESGCFLATWTRVNLRVSHVAPDRSLVLLTFDIAPGTEMPLRMTADMWQKLYAPTTGITATVSNLFVPSEDVGGFFKMLPPVATHTTNLGAEAGSEQGEGVVSKLQNWAIAFVAQNVKLVAEAGWGFYAHVGKDSNSLVPRYLAVPHTPISQFEALTRIEEDGISFMIPFSNGSMDGVPFPMKFSAAGDRPLLNSTMALVVHPATDEGNNPPDFSTLTMDTVPDGSAIIQCIIADMTAQGIQVFLNWGDQGGVSLKYDRRPEQVPELAQTFALYETMERGFSDRLIFTTHTRFLPR